MKSFSLWLEDRVKDQVEMAVLGAVSGGDPLSHDNQNFLLNQRTSEFGSEIKDKLKNLGLITNIENDDPDRYQDIIHSIDTGILIRDLIAKIKGTDNSPIQRSLPITTANPQKGQYF